MGILPAHFCEGRYQKLVKIRVYGRITEKTNTQDIVAVPCDEEFNYSCHNIKNKQIIAY
jgi:hypothetical protein